MGSEPRIRFKNLKGFPVIAEKIETEPFLNAAKEIITVIESFGKLFTPVISDMNGNIVKLTKSYNEDKVRYRYLEELIIKNVHAKGKFAANALLWLKRALELICAFFENIYHDDQKTEAVKQHLQNAYEKTLKPYHGFIVQSTIQIIYSWVPTRSQLIGQGVMHDENMKILGIFLPNMRSYLNQIDALLKEHSFNDSRKV